MPIPEGKIAPDPACHAVVVGAGVSGLLAAATLSKRFHRVTVLERDPPVDPAEPRKGTPQAAHIHLLLIRGAEAVEGILPGVFDEIEASGGLKADSTRDLAFFHYGEWQPRGLADLPARLQTRPFLEWHLARRVSLLPNVTFLNQHEAHELLCTESRVLGLHVRSLQSTNSFPLEADLVVDAAGRGSPIPRWLASRGFPAPRTSEVDLRITYASRLYRAPASAQAEDWRAMLVYPQAPDEFRGGALYFQEGNRWIVTMASYRGEAPPTDGQSFIDFAKTLPSKEIHRLIIDAEPVSEVATYRYRGAKRRHYEDLPTRPKGIVFVGDSVCSFNPVFGQGMTAAALQAEALGKHLDRYGLSDVEAPFSLAVAQICDTPWLLSTTMDFRYPHAGGHRPVWLPVLDRYLKKFFSVTARDYGSLLDFMRVLHMISPPRVLARPRNLAVVVRHGLRRPPTPPSARPPLSAYSKSGEMRRRNRSEKAMF